MSNNLGWTPVAQGQVNNGVLAINNALEHHDQAITGSTSFAATDTSPEIVEADFGRYLSFEVTGTPGGAATLTVPEVSRGVFWVKNSTDELLTVETAGQTLPSPTLLPGQMAQMLCDGSDVLCPTYRYGVPLAYPSTPGASEILSAYIVDVATFFPANFAGAHQGHVGTDPDATFVISVKDDGAEIGTISISDAGVFTYVTTSGTAKTVAAGSLLEFVAPGTPDASIEYIVASLPGIALT